MQTTRLSDEYNMAVAFADLQDYNDRRAAGEIVAIPTGLPFLDNNMIIEAENLVVIAARPKSGKTSLAVNMATQQTLSACARPAFFSFEMPRREITRKILSYATGVVHSDIKNDTLSNQQHAKLMHAEEYLAQSPFMVCDQPGMTLDDIYGHIGGFKAEVGTNIVYIDQLSHINLGAGSIREQFIRGTKGLKRMARELGVAIVLLCQLRRPEDDAHKPPRLRHLKESGSIEEDADIVLMPWRPNSEGDCERIMYKGMEMDVKDKAVIYCRAYREGEIWQELVHFDGLTTTFGRVRA